MIAGMIIWLIHIGIPAFMIGAGLPEIWKTILLTAAIIIQFIPATRRWMPLTGVILWAISIFFAVITPYTWFTTVYIICGIIWLVFEFIPRLFKKEE